jgi:hypothetical protein
MVAALWDGIAARFPGVEIDQFVVMPNHLHGILVLPDAGATTRVATGATTRVAPTDPAIVGAPLVGAPPRPRPPERCRRRIQIIGHGRLYQWRQGQRLAGISRAALATQLL